jgi:hypothetical protein
MTALREIRGVRRVASRLDRTLVYLQGDVSKAPKPNLPDGYWVEQMDMDDRGEVDRWLHVHNHAFGRDWGEGDFREMVVEHPHYDIQCTFLLYDREGALGTVSIGVFRRNAQMGVGHYIAIHPRAQASGLGKQLAFHRCGALGELGVTHAEAETQIARVASVRMWFSCGYEGKRQPEAWNTPDECSPLERAIADRRLARLHRKWLAARS